MFCSGCDRSVYSFSSHGFVAGAQAFETLGSGVGLFWYSYNNRLPLLWKFLTRDFLLKFQIKVNVIVLN